MLDESRVVLRERPKRVDADMLPPSYLALLSIMFAFAALYFAIRALAWCAMYSLISAMLTRKHSEFDRAQVVTSTLATLAVLLVLYCDAYAV